MSLSREDIVQFLESCVHRTITQNTDPERFTTILNALYQHYREIDSEKFSKETLDKINAIRVTRSPKKKSLFVEVRYNDSKKFNAISWTGLYKNKEKSKGTHHQQLNSAMRFHIQTQLSDYSNALGARAECVLCGNENLNDLGKKSSTSSL